MLHKQFSVNGDNVKRNLENIRHKPSVRFLFGLISIEITFFLN